MDLSLNEQKKNISSRAYFSGDAASDVVLKCEHYYWVQIQYCLESIWCEVQQWGLKFVLFKYYAFFCCCFYLKLKTF